MTQHTLPTAGPQQATPIPCLLNPRAGTAKAVVERVEHDPRFIVKVCDPGEIHDAVVDAMAERPARIAIAGGDGTVATAANALVRSGMELAVIPAGTLNHFARSLEIPVKVEDALDVAAGAGCRSVDVGYVNERLFLNTSSAGAYVDFVQERERHRERFGYYLASAVAAARVLMWLPSHTVTVASDEEHRSYRTPLVFLQIREREESQSRQMNETSGRLRLAVVLERRRLRLVGLAFTTAIRGPDAASRKPYMKSFFVDGCTIEVPTSRMFVALDGEPIQMEPPLCFRLEHQALQVVTP